MYLPKTFRIFLDHDFKMHAIMDRCTLQKTCCSISSPQARNPLSISRTDPQRNTDWSFKTWIDFRRKTDWPSSSSFDIQLILLLISRMLNILILPLCIAAANLLLFGCVLRQSSFEVRLPFFFSDSARLVRWRTSGGSSDAVFGAESVSRGDQIS